MKHLLFSLLLIFANTLSAQNWLDALKAFSDGVNNAVQENENSRESIRNSISKWERCKVATLTNTHGTVAIYGDNGYSYNAAIPASLKIRLKKIYDEGHAIVDITISEAGNWLVLYGYAAAAWSGIPPELIDKINDNTERLYSASFNDAGEWTMVTEKHIYASHTNILSFLTSYTKIYGSLLSANICGQGMVACYSSGTTFFGKVPNNVIKAYQEIESYPQFVKFDYCGNYIICKKNEGYAYLLNDPGDINPNYVAYSVNYLPYIAPTTQPGLSTTAPVYSTVPAAPPVITTPTTPTTSGGSTKIICSDCNGTGICKHCQGTGKQTGTSIYTGGETTIYTCPFCNGTGKCQGCYGRGYI